MRIWEFTCVILALEYVFKVARTSWMLDDIWICAWTLTRIIEINVCCHQTTPWCLVVVFAEGIMSFHAALWTFQEILRDPFLFGNGPSFRNIKTLETSEMACDWGIILYRYYNLAGSGHYLYWYHWRWPCRGHLSYGVQETIGLTEVQVM